MTIKPKSLLTLLAAAVLALPAGAQTLKTLPQRISTAPTGNAVNLARAHKGVRLTPAQIKTIEAVTGPQTSLRSRKMVGGNMLSRLRHQAPEVHAPLRANASGSILEGWRRDYWEEADGWYRLDEDGSQELQWVFDGGTDEMGQKIAFPFNLGFLRNGKVYGIGSNMFFYWAMMEYGVFTRAGEMVDHIPCDELSDDLSHYTMSVAYDSANDVAYAYTLNSDGSAYMFQVIDPDTWQYSPLNTDVPLADVCGGIVYNPNDGKLYGLTTDCRFVSINTDDGSQTTVRQYDMEPSSSLKSMAYSPYDNAFAFVVPDEYGTAQLCYIDASTYDYVEKGYIWDTNQYPILVCADTPVQPQAPAVATIDAVTFNGGDLQGTASLTLPSTTFDGSALTGPLTLVTLTDFEETARTQAQPGQKVEVAVSVPEQGRHTFRFVVEKDGLQGPGTERSLYVGFDTPLAPEGVELTTELIHWHPVTEGVHGGYIDLDELTYNVYIDNKLFNTQPIADTTLVVSMPEGYFKTHVAQVEAVNHGLKSDRAYSNDVNSGKPLPLPLDMAPSATQAKLFTVVSGSKSPYDRWNFYSDCFEVYTHAYDAEHETDEWLMLPPVTIPETDKLIEISWEAHANYADCPENLTVAFGPTPDPEAMTVVETFDDITNEEFASMSTWAAIDPGTCYVAFKTRKSGKGNKLALKSFYVAQSKMTSTSPARVSGLSAQGMPQGQNAAMVDFDMPLLDMAGNPLPASEQLTAQLECGSHKASATGLPGSHQSVQIETRNGWNDISVTVSGGIPATTRAFTGLDIPSPITVMTVKCAPDNLGMTLNWEAPTTGINGGYVNPDDITYNLCLIGQNGWEIANDLGKSRTVSLSIDEGPQGLAQAGVMASNASGHSDTFRSTTQALGTPFPLPLAENFEYSDFSVKPSYIEVPTEEYSENQAFYNFYYDDIPDGKNCLLLQPNYDMDHSYCRVVMPKVCMKDAKNPTVEMRLFCGPDAGLMRVIAESYEGEETLVGEFDCQAAEPHFQGVRMAVPQQFTTLNWTALKLEGEFRNQAEQRVGIESVLVADLLNQDLEITSLDVPRFLLTSQTAPMKACVRNSGLETMPLPTMTCNITVDSRVVATVEMTPDQDLATIEPMQTVNYTANWTPDVEAGNGAVAFTTSIDTADDCADNNTLTANATVCRGNQALINDLKAEPQGDDVSLTWTEPKAADGTEGFENYAAFSYYEQLGDFSTVDQDGMDLTYFTLQIPGMGAAKAWQVFGKEDLDGICAEAMQTNDWFSAHSGDKAIVAMTPFSPFVGEGLQADDWLISPSLQPGSDFSFWAMSLLGNTEDIEVLTSDDTETWSFQSVKHVYPFGIMTWIQYTFTLPEGHRYFAIRYVGNSDAHTGVAIDDIRYSPDAPASDPVVGYDIIRCGAPLVQNQPCPGSYADMAALATIANPYYNVVPVMQGAAGTYRGQVSNTAHIGTVGMDQLGSGHHGADATYDLMGRKTRPTAHGVYIEVRGGKATKVVR